jgi:hypothetical protein
MEDSEYHPTWHVLPTSNVCERLFSRAKLVFSERRKRMSPETLEIILYLFCNYELWSPSTVQSACVDKRVDKPKRTPDIMLNSPVIEIEDNHVEYVVPELRTDMYVPPDDDNYQEDFDQFHSFNEGYGDEPDEY